MIRIEEIIDDLVTKESGVLDLSHLHGTLCRKVDDGEFEELLEAISTKDKIKTIILAEPYRRSSDAENKKLGRLLTSIRNNVNITHLILEGGEHIDLELDEIEDDKFNRLMTAIDNPNLKRLSFPKSRIFSCGMKRFVTIFRKIQDNESITYLDLSENRIGVLENVKDHDSDSELEDGDEAILSVFTSFITNNKSLQYLKLCYTNLLHFPEFKFSQFAQTIANNKSLKFLDLSWNDLGLLDDKRFGMLIDALRKNEGILYVKITPQSYFSPATQERQLSPERLKVLHDILIPRITPITYLGHSIVRVLKNIMVNESKLGKTLPLGIIKKVLSFCPLNEKLRGQAVLWEFTKSQIKSTLDSVGSEAQKKVEAKVNEVLVTSQNAKF